MASPHIASRAAMTGEDFVRLRVLAAESIATPMVEGADAHAGKRPARARPARFVTGTGLEKWIDRMENQSVFGCSMSGLVRYAG